MNGQPTRRPLIAAGAALGMGMGGFVDGIVLHQILQLHNMLSARLPPTTVPNIEINMVWDGLFHALTWCFTAVGLALLWRAVRRSDVVLGTRTLLGSMILGWGVFNLVEGVIDHHLLGVHHVVERLGLSIYDWLFLLSGVVLIAIGIALIRVDMSDTRRIGPRIANTNPQGDDHAPEEQGGDRDRRIDGHRRGDQ